MSSRQLYYLFPSHCCGCLLSDFYRGDKSRAFLLCLPEVVARLKDLTRRTCVVQYPHSPSLPPHRSINKDQFQRKKNDTLDPELYASFTLNPPLSNTFSQSDFPTLNYCIFFISTAYYSHYCLINTLHPCFVIIGR